MLPIEEAMAFVNRHHNTILSDIRKGNIPGDDIEMFVFLCMSIEEDKHPHSKKPRPSVLRALHDLLQYRVIENITEARSNDGDTDV